MRILVYGYGNPGRQDDALGVLFIEQLEKIIESENLSDQNHTISVDSNYQLNVEDALLISEYDLVIFADASMEDIDCLWFRQIEAVKIIAFSTHAMNPESILALCKDLYKKEPVVYLLSIRGYEWELGKEMTQQAKDNLERAISLIFPYLQQPEALFSKIELRQGGKL